MAEGTYHCPICYKATPHTHSDLEVEKYRENQIAHNTWLMEKHTELTFSQAWNRMQKQEAAKLSLIEDFERAKDALENHEIKQPCDFCRDLPKGNEKLKGDCDKIYGLEVHYDKTGADDDWASCPVCKQIMAEWE